MGHFLGYILPNDCIIIFSAPQQEKNKRKNALNLGLFRKCVIFQIFWLFFFFWPPLRNQLLIENVLPTCRINLYKRPIESFIGHQSAVVSYKLRTTNQLVRVISIFKLLKKQTSISSKWTSSWSHQSFCQLFAAHWLHRTVTMPVSVQHLFLFCVCVNFECNLSEYKCVCVCIFLCKD